MIPTNIITEITKPRTSETKGGMIVSTQCIARHEGADGAVWLLWRKSIGPTRCGCEIECAIVCQEGGRWRWKIETELGGFTGADCPYEWLARTKAQNWDWRDLVWQHHEDELTEQHRDCA